MTKWDEVVRKIAPQVVKVEAHDSWGSGFIAYGDRVSWVRTIATAYHVIENSYGNPFDIVSETGRFTFGDRPNSVLTARIGELDAVTLVLIHRDLPLPVVPLLERNESPVTVGVEIGWLGYPRIADELCFFSGRVSAIVDDNHFLVDGTAIHGVSGGPAFCITENGPRIVGSITAYRPNLIERGALPGLSFVTHAAAHRDIDVEVTSSNRIRIINRSP